MSISRLPVLALEQRDKPQKGPDRSGPFASYSTDTV